MQIDKIQLLDIHYNYIFATNCQMSILSSIDVTALYNTENKIQVNIKITKELTIDEIKEEIIKKFA